MKGLFKIAMFAIPMCFCIDSGAMNFDKPDPNLNEPPLQFGVYNYWIENGKLQQRSPKGFEPVDPTSISNYYNLKAALNWTPRERQQHKAEFISKLFAGGRGNKYLSKFIKLAKETKDDFIKLTQESGAEYFDELDAEVHSCNIENAEYLFPHIFAIEYPDSLIEQLNNIEQGSGIILTSDIIQELKEMGDIRDSMQQ